MKIFNTYILIGTMMLLLVSCGDKQAAIKKQISQKKAQIEKLKSEIAELEKQVGDSTEERLAIPVVTKEMVGEEFRHYIIAYGEVEAEDYAQISTEMGGRIAKIHVDEGSRAEAGQLIVSLNTESVANNIKQLETNLELATITFEKQKNLWDQGIGSEIQYLQAKTNKESLESQLASIKAQQRMSQVRAPFTGYVNKIYFKEGEYSAPGFPLVEMVNLNKLSLTADLSEEHLGSIRKGQYVDVTFAPLPDVKLSVPVKRISNVINVQNRSFEIELEFNNKNELIKPNMVSTITINDFKADSAFVLPSIIIKQDIKGKYLFRAAKENGKTVAQKTYVKTGLSYNENTMVKEGLAHGDKVIVKGYNVVSTGVPVVIK
ncbi:MAG: efflux RND transporter periplasmic adaptor subunit [Bacteroidales bacterium]|nr:efflux RND transporter periplasmic adaptor subunit [Bacteroidales bacterium]